MSQIYTSEKYSVKTNTDQISEQYQLEILNDEKANQLLTNEEVTPEQNSKVYF